MKALLLAAGLGTRLKPFTDFHPKALAQVNGKSLLQRNIDYLAAFGINEIVINVHHHAEQIITFIEQIKTPNVRFCISDERTELLETGGGLLKASSFLNGTEPFVMMNTDILTRISLHDMLQFHKEQKSIATLAISKRTSSRVLLFNAAMQLCGWRNITLQQEIISRVSNPVEEYAFSGVQIIEPAIFSVIEESGRFSIIDLYLRLAQNHTIAGYLHHELVLDVGKPESLIEAEQLFTD
ncbi:MAG TPA: nucleotidyltransferase family protein [Chitinophagaceae bacterium]|nr:nucleotidyltransferase family protein [Chitinophagaceae bacterium]